MRPRLSLGILTAILMVHLTLVGSDRVCADHGVAGPHPASSERSSEDAPDHDHHGATSADAGADDDECRMPTRPRCCEALASCSVSVDVSSGSNDLDTRGLLAVAIGRSPVILQSHPAGPEPPPPRV